ncbi:DUF748 domain-containing protein [Salinimonas chungwhensis]|uniref:DUF748 domain-containing protein n=1 Tax=Salinimonas chungwhensis TaxID=265425 RepID=UPI0003724C32|nr:hypothetical protein [Salinimonas chungwhensis]
MKKVLTILLVVIVLIVGAVWYVMSGAGDFIRTQLEQQGSEYMGAEVSVASVEIAYSDAKMNITGLEVANPDGFSDDTAMAMNALSFDLGALASQPYVVQNVTIDAPDILYEMNGQNQSNLLVLKNNLQNNLPAGEQQEQPQGDKDMPRVIVENVTISNARLRLNFEAVETGELQIDKKSYEITLPTFNAGPVGQPNGLPADQVGGAIMESLLDNAIEQAKQQAREKLKARARQELEKETDKLKEKAQEKLKGLFNKGNG